MADLDEVGLCLLEEYDDVAGLEEEDGRERDLSGCEEDLCLAAGAAVSGEMICIGEEMESGL